MQCPLLSSHPSPNVCSFSLELCVMVQIEIVQVNPSAEAQDHFSEACFH